MNDYEQALEQIQQYQQFLKQQLDPTAAMQGGVVTDVQEELQVAYEELQTAYQELIDLTDTLVTEQQHYRSLFEFATDGYLVTDHYGRILEANQAAVDRFGVRAYFLQGKPLSIFVAQSDRAIFRQHLLKLQKPPEDWPNRHLEWTLKFQPRLGQPFAALLRVAPIYNPLNRSPTFCWLLRDITPRVKVEEELRRALKFEAMLRSITEHIRGSLDESQILRTVVEELTLLMNLKGCDAGLYDLSQRTSTIQYEYVVSMPSALGKVVGMNAFPQGYRQLLQGQEFQFCSLSNERLPSLRGAMAILACPIVDNQQALGDLWLFRPQDAYFDEAEIRLVQQVAGQCAIAIRQARLYQAAQEQIEAMESLNRLKDDFLSTISHELRTPITNIKMALRLLEHNLDSEKRDRYLAILQDECDREVELITNLLDLQRLQAESYPRCLAESIDLREWLTRWAEPWRSRMTERQQSLELHFDELLPTLVSDRASLGRLVNELLYNAYKYTPQGGAIAVSVVKLSVAQSSETRQSLLSSQATAANASSEMPLQVKLMVQNSAEISAEHLPHIFEKFYRVPNSQPWSQSGTGLGLALVQKLVEFMQGVIQVESQSGWTSFTIYLPTYAVP